MNTPTQRKQSLVYKANSLVEAKYRLSAIEQKLLLLLIAKVNPDKPDFENPYAVTFDEAADALGIEHGGSQYSQVHSAFEKLMSRLVKIYEENEDGKIEENTILWFYRRKYVCGSNHFRVWFHEDLKKYVIQLSNFLKYSTDNIFRLRSSYSIRLYEMLKNWELKGHKSFDLAELRGKLGLREKEYPLYGSFKQKIILVAQRELKENSDISFDFKERKISRKVAEITFFIKQNTPTGSKPKKKRGRPKKQVSQEPQQLMLFGPNATFPVYSDELDARLKKVNIMHLDQYRAEGITEKDWTNAEDSGVEKKAAYLITAARAAKAVREGMEKDEVHDAELELLKKAHRNYAEKEQQNLIEYCSFDFFDKRMVRILIQKSTDPRATVSNSAVYGKDDFYRTIDMYLNKADLDQRDGGERRADLEKAEEIDDKVRLEEDSDHTERYKKDRRNVYLEREPNKYVEAFKKMSHRRHEVLSRVIQAFPLLETADKKAGIRTNNTKNKESVQYHLVGRASKMDKENGTNELEKIFEDFGVTL